MKKIVISACFICIVTIAQAQSPAKEKPSNYKAAEELMTALNMDKTVDEGVAQMMDLQIKSNPMLESKRDVFLSFMKKYVSWAALREDYIQIYTSEFTEAELKDLTVFYRTPTGKKVASKQNVIMMKGAQLGQERVQAHLSELQEMMK